MSKTNHMYVQWRRDDDGHIKNRHAISQDLHNTNLEWYNITQYIMFTIIK